MNKAFSLIRFKAFEQGEERYIEGIATTPTTDRVGDIVDPMGATFGETVNLHLYHDTTLPVGKVKFGKPTRKGIPFKAWLPNVVEAGTVRDRVDEAWHSLKYGLIGAVSIGFRVMRELKEAGDEVIEFLENGGIKFLKTEIMELSLVSIPANPEAVITGIKSLDKELRAALGQKTQLRDGGTVRKSAGASAQESTSKGKHMNLQERKKSYENKRGSLASRMEDLMKAADDEGRTLNEEESEQYAELEAELDAVDKHLDRIGKQERLQVKMAVKTVIKPSAEGGDDEDDQSLNLRNPNARVVSVEKKLEPGVEFARFVMALGAAKGDIPQALAIAQHRFKESPRIINVLKSAVAGGTTSDATWAGPLLEYNQFAGDFIEYLRPQTIIGKFGTNGIPSLRRVPFNINIRGQSSGGNGYWVGQGRPKPLTKVDFNNVYLGFTKVANIAVLTEELIRFSNPSAEMLVRDALRDALLERLDTDFVDPDLAAVANVSPASVTYGVTPITSNGADADGVREDVRALMTAYINANITPTTGVWIMPATIALSLSLMRNELGQKEFPDITMNGGTFEGLPVITSQYVENDSTGSLVILANASDIFLADDGLVTVEASREASLQMDNEPTNRADTGTGASLVSMFQTNSVAIKAERYINWQKRRAQAVQVLEEVTWGAAS